MNGCSSTMMRCKPFCNSDPSPIRNFSYSVPNSDSIVAVCNSSYFDLIPIPILSVFPYPNLILTDPDYILMQILILSYILSYINVIILTTYVHSASISFPSSGMEHRLDYRCNHHYPHPVLPFDIMTPILCNITSEMAFSSLK